jgi:hypothetical protein
MQGYVVKTQKLTILVRLIMRRAAANWAWVGAA